MIFKSLYWFFAYRVVTNEPGQYSKNMGLKLHYLQSYVD